MTVAALFIDTSQTPGQQVAPELAAEIAALAPSAVVNGSITTAKLADDAVTGAKIAPGAVGSVEIATNGVAAVNIAADAVSTAKIANGSVTPAKTGTGVMTVVDSTNTAIQGITKPLTAAQYAALGTYDPNTFYFVS
jgi:hypothetical protein